MKRDRQQPTAATTEAAAGTRRDQQPTGSTVAATTGKKPAPGNDGGNGGAPDNQPATPPVPNHPGQSAASGNSGGGSGGGLGRAASAQTTVDAEPSGSVNQARHEATAPGMSTTHSGRGPPLQTTGTTTQPCGTTPCTGSPATLTTTGAPTTTSAQRSDGGQHDCAAGGCQPDTLRLFGLTRAADGTAVPLTSEDNPRREPDPQPVPQPGLPPSSTTPPGASQPGAGPGADVGNSGVGATAATSSSAAGADDPNPVIAHLIKQQNAPGWPAQANAPPPDRDFSPNPLDNGGAKTTGGIPDYMAVRCDSGATSCYGENKLGDRIPFTRDNPTVPARIAWHDHLLDDAATKLDRNRDSAAYKIGAEVPGLSAAQGLSVKATSEGIVAGRRYVRDLAQQNYDRASPQDKDSARALLDQSQRDLAAAERRSSDAGHQAAEEAVNGAANIPIGPGPEVKALKTAAGATKSGRSWLGKAKDLAGTAWGWVKKRFTKDDTPTPAPTTGRPGPGTPHRDDLPGSSTPPINSNTITEHDLRSVPKRAGIDADHLGLTPAQRQARWTMRWKPALNAFANTFGDRWPSAEKY